MSMGQGNHSGCPVELLTCPSHAGQRDDQHGEPLSGVNVFAESLQSLLDAAVFEGGGGTETEDKQ
jgi:hypothetical protein